jgi:tetratricopeptide (TPR) repeat protein
MQMNAHKKRHSCHRCIPTHTDGRNAPSSSASIGAHLWRALFLHLRSSAFICGCILLLLTGCGPTKQEIAAQKAVERYFLGDYESSRQILRELAQNTDENFALNNVRLGSAALIDYRLDEAEAAFLKAYEVMNSVGVNRGGRTAGAVLVDEKIKVWKGEPFERAMTNFYLGLIYYIRHDYENARAAFENALFKLRDYGERKDGIDPADYQDIESNFALGYFMLGKSWQRLGREDLARANLHRAAELAPGLSAAADHDLNAQSNVLLVVDYGYGPQFFRSFDGAIAGFGPHPEQVGPVPEPMVYVDGAPCRVPGLDRAPVDLLALAQERRWQSIDTIRTIKSAVGTGLIAGGAGYGLYRAGRDDFRAEDALIAGALIGTGLLLKGTSQADTRQWEMLPRSTFVIPLRLEPGRHDLTVRFPPTIFAPAYQQTWQQIIAPPAGEATYYLRMRKWGEGPFNWAEYAPAGDPRQSLTDLGR